MTIRLTCPGCGKRVTCKDHLAGKQVRCPGCRGPIAVPQSPEAKSPDAGGASREVVLVEESDPEPMPLVGAPPVRSAARPRPAAPPTVLIVAGIVLGMLAVGLGTYFIVKSQRHDQKEGVAKAAPGGKESQRASVRSPNESSRKETGGQGGTFPIEKTRPATPPVEPETPQPPVEPAEPKSPVKPPVPEPKPKEGPQPPMIDAPEFEIIVPTERPPSAEPEPDQPEAKGEPAEPKEEPAEPKGSKRKPRRPRQKTDEQEPPAVVGPPDPNCPTCCGLGVVPLEKPTPYVHVEGMPAPKPELAVPHRYCPKCQAGRDPAEMVEAEKRRLAIAGQGHQQWEQKLQTNLVRVENHHATIHAQLPPNEAQAVGAAVEAMTAHLQQLTRSMELTSTRPDTYEILIILGKPNYLGFLRLMQEEWAEKVGNDWGLLPDVAGSTVDKTSFFHHVPGNSPPPAHMAVFMAASRQVSLATGHQAPTWLKEGFAAYCEYAVLQKNLVHSISYEITQVQIGPNWAMEIRRLAAMGQLKPWAAVASLELREYKPIDYLTCYGIVAFLIQTDPAKFLDFTRRLRDGLDWPTALERAYGENVDKLQQRWVAWLTGRG